MSLLWWGEEKSKWDWNCEEEEDEGRANGSENESASENDDSMNDVVHVDDGDELIGLTMTVDEHEDDSYSYFLMNPAMTSHYTLDIILPVC